MSSRLPEPVKRTLTNNIPRVIIYILIHCTKSSISNKKRIINSYLPKMQLFLSYYTFKPTAIHIILYIRIYLRCDVTYIEPYLKESPTLKLNELRLCAFLQ